MARRARVRIFRPIVAVIALACLLPLAWLAGETIKDSAGSGDDQSQVFDSVVTAAAAKSIQSFTSYLLAGRSTFYYSLLYTSQAADDDLSAGGVSPLILPLQTALFRLSYLTGGLVHFERPDIGSLMRLNYVLLVAHTPTLREGTSPGLIASFMYVFPGPIAMMMAALFAFAVARLTDRLLDHLPGSKLSGVGCFIAYVYLETLFHSPFDYLMIFDDSVVFLLLLIIFAMNDSNAQRRSPVAARPSMFRQQEGASYATVL